MNILFLIGAFFWVLNAVIMIFTDEIKWVRWVGAFSAIINAINLVILALNL